MHPFCSSCRRPGNTFCETQQVRVSRTQGFYALTFFTARAIKAIGSVGYFQKLLDDISKNEVEIQQYERLDMKKSANDQYLALRTFMGAYDDHLKRV